MTIGDIIEKIQMLCGMEPRRTRLLRAQLAASKDRIRMLEDGITDIRRNISEVEKQMEFRRADLKAATTENEQDLILDMLDALDNEFGRLRDRTNQRLQYLNSARAVRTRIEQVLEAQIAQPSRDELTELIGEIETLNAELRDIGDLTAQLDRRTTGISFGTKTAENAADEAKRRAERRARYLGKSAGAETASEETASAPAPVAPKPTAATTTEETPNPTPAPAV